MDESIDVRLAREEERSIAAKDALLLVAESFKEYRVSSNEWRQALNDQRVGYVTRGEMIAVVVAGMALVGLVMRMFGK